MRQKHKIFQLVYFSSAKSNFNYCEIKTLLDQSRVDNANVDITGALVYGHGEFLQLLEGEEAKVKELFNKIKIDTRHQNVISLAEEFVGKRFFTNLTMSFFDIKTDENSKLLFSNRLQQFEEVLQTPNYATEIFWTMAKYLALG